MEEKTEQIEEKQKLVSDIISEEEIELFYKLLPKVQEAQFFIESLNNPTEEESEEEENSNSDKPIPYVIELDTNCKVFKKGNSATTAPETVYHENKKFYIDFIVSDYKAFIETFFVNLQESLTKTCKDLYKSNDKPEENTNE